MINEKKCKGTGKAKGFDACGKLVPVQMYGKANRVYGLGKSCGCYQRWLLETKEGQAKLRQTTLKAVERVRKQKDIKEARAEREWRKKTSIELMSANKYRDKVLQPIINEIARLIDYGQPCIATGNYGKENGGHYISVGSNVTLALNLHNIHIQSFESNHHKSGDTINYQNGIRAVYGEEYLDFMNSLQGCPPLYLRKQQLIDLTEKAKDIRKRLKADLRTRNSFERVELRNKINSELAIYERVFSIFKKKY